jgi:acetylornithine deacetylase/succinyl-diaminopimelate desuccinylase-like protein
VQAAVGDEVEVTLTEGDPGAAADPASPFFDALATTMAAADPGAALLPDLISGGTDASSLPGIKVYGFMPSRHNAALIKTMHGDDERTSIDDLLFATRCIYETIARFCAE